MNDLVDVKVVELMNVPAHAPADVGAVALTRKRKTREIEVTLRAETALRESRQNCEDFRDA